MGGWLVVMAMAGAVVWFAAKCVGEFLRGNGQSEDAE